MNFLEYSCHLLFKLLTRSLPSSPANLSPEGENTGPKAWSGWVVGDAKSEEVMEVVALLVCVSVVLLEEAGEEEGD